MLSTELAQMQIELSFKTEERRTMSQRQQQVERLPAAAGCLYTAHVLINTEQGRAADWLRGVLHTLAVLYMDDNMINGDYGTDSGTTGG